MRSIKLLFGIAIFSLFFSSCSVDVIEYNDAPQGITLRELLGRYEVWYVDIHETTGNGEIPFVQKAFTLSFRNGTLYANNNLVGIGSTGGGFGLDIGYYNSYDNILEVSHDIDGYWAMEVHQLSANKIRLYHPPSNTSYYLYGYQRNTFDYDLVFYDNIHYFLQEYEAWEKIATIGGNANEFDEENFLAFLTGGNNSEFLSSRDNVGTPIHALYWDYSGLYNIANFTDTNYVKALTLDYDYLGNEYFELSVISDGEIELYHPSSDTAYRFVGRHFIQFRKAAKERKREKIVLKDFRVESSKRAIKK